MLLEHTRAFRVRRLPDGLGAVSGFPDFPIGDHRLSLAESSLPIRRSRPMRTACCFLRRPRFAHSPVIEIHDTIGAREERAKPSRSCWLV
jgi:hypothetical protein